MSDKSITGKINHEIWSKDFPGLYWPSMPASLEIQISIQQKITKELNLNSYSGSYRTSDSTQRCIIREITGNKIFLEYLARLEAKNLQYLAKESFFAKHYGFYLESIDNDQLKYVMVFQEYPHTWENLKNFDDEEQILKLSRQALNALMVMQGLGIYHGSLSPLNLYLDDNFNLKIGNFLHSGIIRSRQKKFPWILEGLRLINRTYAAPEQRFALLCMEGGYLIHPYNLLKADIFSLGACILNAIPNTQIFNELKGLGLRHYTNTEINKSSAYNNKMARLNNKFIYVKKSIDQLQGEINEGISKCRNERVKLILLDMMNVHYEERSDYSELLSILDNVERVKLDSPEILPSIDSSLEDPEFLIYADILEVFIEALTRARYILYSNDEHIEIFSQEINSILNRYEEELQIAKRQQLSCLIGSPTNIYHGLQCFFDKFFKLLQSPSNIKMFLEHITPILPEELSNDYIQIFNEICQFDEIQKDCVVSGLQDVNLLEPRGWSFFFPRDPRTLSYSQFYSFASSPFPGEFNKLIESKVIQEELSKFIKAGGELQNIYYNEILPNIYLGNLFPGTTGYTTTNRRIFIKDYSRKNADASESIRGAIYVVLLHEISHFLRRRSCESREDWSREITPPDEDNPQAIRGEAGYWLEKKLFDSRLNFINDTAARFLINQSCTELEEFRAKFVKINVQEDGHTTTIHRAMRGKFKGVRCPMKYSTSFQ